VDLSGESAYPGSPLIGWDCSGQWNQLFRLLPDCTVSIVQPEVIGRVRGFEAKNISFCFEPKPVPGEDPALGELHLHSAGCVAELNPLMTKIFGSKSNKTTMRELKNRALRRVQQFEFLLRDGEAVRAYDRRYGGTSMPQTGRLPVPHPQQQEQQQQQGPEQGGSVGDEL
jgi:hypothetical protein